MRTDDGKAEFGLAIGYWTALDHLLRYQLGWSQPAKGLARWLDRGAKEVGRPLALVRRIWLQDGHLERYPAWRIEKAQEQVGPPQLTEHLSQITYRYGERGVPVGPWQLHLEEPGKHALEPQDGEPPAEVRIIGGDQSRHAPDPVRVMLFDDPAGLESGWYGYLHGRELGGGPIQVISLRHGPVGMYRRSPHTKRWHSVDEALHRSGNPG